MAVADDAAVGDVCGVKELGVDALVALAGALVAREAAFGRAPVEAVVVLQLVECPVVEPQRHVVFRAVCLLPAQVHGVADDLRDAWAGGVVYGHLRRGAQVVDPLVVLGVVSVVVHKVEVDAVRARCREVKGEVVARGAQAVVAGPCWSRRVANAFMAAAVPVGGNVHARLGLGRAVGLGYVEGRRGARGGVVPRDGEGDAVLGCGGGVGVAGLWRGGNHLGRGGGLGSQGWGGGGGRGGSAVSGFRVGLRWCRQRVPCWLRWCRWMLRYCPLRYPLLHLCWCRFPPCLRRRSWHRLAPAARLLPEAGWLPRWPPWASRS